MVVVEVVVVEVLVVVVRLCGSGMVKGQNAPDCKTQHNGSLVSFVEAKSVKTQHNGTATSSCFASCA